jgi:pantetheine-phosphate adenylyltransferase
VDIIQRIAVAFDHTVVLIANSPTKSGLFTTQERKELIQKSLLHVPNVSVEIFEGLTVDFMRTIEAQVIVRGLRAVVDFEYEMTMASMNKKIAPDIETMLVFARPEYYYISSRGVKEVASYGGPLDGLVPDPVIPALRSKYLKKK